MTVRVKICGITSIDDAMLCIGAGVDAIGFVTEYPIPVPWNLSRKRSRELISKIPPFISTTVVTTGSLSDIFKIAKDTAPNIVQLHGEESINDIEKVVETLSINGIKVIKALSIDIDAQKAHFEISNPIEAAQSLQETGIDALLLDSRTKTMPAGTGRTISWKLAREIKEKTSIPLILAGGLNQSNVRSAISSVRPYAVDVITGVEIVPGIKDPYKVKAFVNAVKTEISEETLDYRQIVR